MPNIAFRLQISHFGLSDRSFGTPQARELWKFCWSGGSGSHVLFVARTLELWAAEADQVDWWEEAERRRRRR